MKAKKQKGFWKCEYNLVDRFKDPHELLLYVSLRCLARDREGRIPMHTEALASRLNWPLDKLTSVLVRLMEPDPNSRCQTAGGACVAYIDPNRPELGFCIPAVPRHRKRNANTDGRRAYRRAWMKENRPSRAKNRGELGVNRGELGVNKGELPRPSKVNRGELGVNKGEQKVNCDSRREKGEGNMNSKPGGSTLPRRGPDEMSVEAAKSAIKHDLFDGDLPEKNWSPLALQNLIRILPDLTKDEIFTVGWWWTYESNPKMPELNQRPAYGLEKILEHWPELYTRAKTWDQRHFPSMIKYPDPLA